MTTAQQGTNGYDPDKVGLWVKEIERHAEQIASYKGEHMERCRSVRERIAAVYDLAADGGVPKKELKRVIRVRRLERDLDNAATFEDALEQETFEQIMAALGQLGDTPLGQAVPKPDANAEAAAANTAALKAGIKQAPDDFDKDVRPRHLQQG